MYSSFFQNDTSAQWKIDFTVKAISENVGVSIGSSSLILALNQLPYGGSCKISPTSGFAYYTNFTLNCSNWIDSDGNIKKYEFFGQLIEISPYSFFNLFY